MIKLWNPKKSGFGSVAAMRSALKIKDGSLDGDELRHWIDHTLLRPDADAASIEKLYGEALSHHFHSVCVNPFWVRRVAEGLRASTVRTCSVIGFPLGAQHPLIKQKEASQALSDGADELDMVLNIGALKSKMYHALSEEIGSIARLCHGGEHFLKVILESALLTDAEIVEACHLCRDAGAHFVKTSTGFGPSGASLHAVQLMRKAVGDDLGVKASGGISDFETALAMIDAGATRIGTSKGLSLISRTP